MKNEINVLIFGLDKKIERKDILKSIEGLNPESAKGKITWCEDIYSPFDNGWNWRAQQLLFLSKKEGKLLAAYPKIDNFPVIKEEIVKQWCEKPFAIVYAEELHSDDITNFVLGNPTEKLIFTLEKL
jgi:hypothetical protein